MGLIRWNRDQPGRRDDNLGAVTPSSSYSSSSPANSKPAKPSKPSPEFPLTAIPAGDWCTKARCKPHYFGPWCAPGAALANYKVRKDALQSGLAAPVPASRGS